MFQSVYYVEKSSNTFADNLAAIGFAFVINGIAEGRAKVRLEDGGSVWVLYCEPTLRQDWVEKCNFFTGAPLLITYDKKMQKKVIKGTNLLPADLPEGEDTGVDYEVSKKSNEIFFAWLKNLSDQEKKLVVHGELRGPAAPHPDWDIFRAVNPAALQAYNSTVAEWWQGRQAFPELLKIMLQLFSQTPNNVDEAEQSWAKLCKARGWAKSKEATAIQLLNPTQGKGTNSAKAGWRAPGNMSSFWLLEWLKMVGLRYGGITRQIRGAKDRKTYVLAPMRLEWKNHVRIMGEFKRAMTGSASAVKLDILAALRYTQALLEHYEGARIEDLEAELYGHRANDLVSGFQTAFYKDMGNAVVTMNIASINLPAWVRPQNAESLAQLQTALDEHLIIIRTLDESRGDQFDLLCHYRDFLSANDLRPFFAFTTAYSSFIIHQYERQQYVCPFTTTTLEILFMNTDDKERKFSEIVQNEGFRNIAYAIRYSTVVPQSQKTQHKKGKGKKPEVDVRYGLGQQLVRNAAYPVDFLAEVMLFTQLYNAENYQLRENDRNPFRKNVTINDLDALTELVDHFGSKVVCNMLVAYGYARPPYKGKDDGLVAGVDAELPEDQIGSSDEVEE